MIASEARIAANRKNALKSSGPKTPAGKQKSRANALKHGLTAEVLRTPEEIEVLGEPTERPPGKLGASLFDRAWLTGEIELLALRISRAGLMEFRLRGRLALRASICWDGDRRSEAESVGDAIRKKPASVASKLEQSVQGCHWMIDRWAMLARAAGRDGDWDDSARSLAFDLLGVPPELRKGRPGEEIDVDGSVLNPGTDFADLARSEVARLLADFERETAEAGLAEDLGAAGRRLRGYESALQRRMTLYLELLAQCPAEDAPPAPQPTSTSTPAESDEAEPKGSSIPLPAPSRHEHRANRAERRRAAAKRKLERRLQ